MISENSKKYLICTKNEKNKLWASESVITTLKGPIMTPNKYDESSSGWMSRQSHNYQYTHTLPWPRDYNGMWHTAWGHCTLGTGSRRVVMVDCCEVRCLQGIFIWHIANIYIHLEILIWSTYHIAKNTTVHLSVCNSFLLKYQISCLIVIKALV